MSATLRYRIWQFWKSLRGSLREAEWRKISALLSPAELALFKRLSVPDQNHSLRVLETLQARGETDPELQTAALLHDLGKIRYPLKRWERVFAVLVTGMFPHAGKRWGSGSPTGWQRPLVIIHRHPAWGADLAEQAGTSSRAVWLIRNHENPAPPDPNSANDLILLNKLQKADDQS